MTQQDCAFPNLESSQVNSKACQTNIYGAHAMNHMNPVQLLRSTGLPAPAAKSLSRLCAKLLVSVGPVCGASIASPAAAADGCLVLLCFAAPSWRAIPQCVPPIREVLRDLARGKPFPTCSMAGAGNSASNAWAAAPGFCPPQYTRLVQAGSEPIYTCDYNGAVSVSINGAPFARTWWNMGGDSVTEFSPTAKSQLGTWDTRFDDEYAEWLATVPAPAPTQVESGGP